MAVNKCKFCGIPFSPKQRAKGKGADQEYCQPNHRRYENTYQWLKRMKEGSRGSIGDEVLDESSKKQIKEAVNLMVHYYGDALKKLAKE